jgi:hypothetical protein
MPKPTLILIALMAVVPAACVEADAPGVRADSVQTDIVFDAAKPAVGPNPPPTVGVGDGSSAAPLIPTPFRNELPARFANVRFALSPGEAASDCPPAPLGAAPAQAAPETATAPPQEGLYRYKRSGRRAETINDQSYDAEITGFEPHVIRDLEQSSETLWRFKDVEPVSDGVLVTSWMVNADPTEARNPTTDGRGVSTPYLGENAYRAGEPGRGIALVSQERYDGNGNLIGTFAPSTPILYLPLPVVQGDSFTAVGVDPKTGQSMRVDGEVAKRQTVDACGTLVDGWLVTAAVTQSQDGAAYTYATDLIFATDRGGQLVSRHDAGEYDTPQGHVKFDVTISLGQVDPSPAEARS